jgi:hypothetical protein
MIPVPDFLILLFREIFGKHLWFHGHFLTMDSTAEQEAYTQDNVTD